MKFPATILVSDKTATGIRVPAEVVEGLGPSRRPAGASPPGRLGPGGGGER